MQYVSDQSSGKIQLHCDYCHGLLRFEVITKKKHVPHATKDLGLTEESPGWICDACGLREDVLLPAEQCVRCQCYGISGSYDIGNLVELSDRVVVDVLLCKTCQEACLEEMRQKALKAVEERDALLQERERKGLCPRCGGKKPVWLVRCDKCH